MKQYIDLVQHVLDNGTIKPNRTGTDTLGLFGYFYKCDMADGFPLLTTKRIKWELIVLENLWFMSGSDKADFLRHYNVKFWEPWTNEDGVVANCYGPAWMQFPVHTQLGNKTLPDFNNQIDWAINELRNNPFSRRIVISAWSPGVAQKAILPPCHVTFVLNTQVDRQGDLCLNLALLQRSADIAIGIPFNVAGYSFLLHLFAHLTGLKVGSFAHTLVDAHIYVDHLPNIKEQIARQPKPLPKLCISPDIKELSDIQELIVSRPAIADILNIFRLEDYDPHPAVTYNVAV